MEMNRNNRPFIIRADKVKEFIEESNKNVVPKEFLDKCRESASLFKREECRSLDMNIIKNKTRKAITMDEALKDVVPIEWSDEVLNGEKKVIISEWDEITNMIQEFVHREGLTKEEVEKILEECMREIRNK